MIKVIYAKSNWKASSLASLVLEGTLKVVVSETFALWEWNT